MLLVLLHKEAETPVRIDAHLVQSVNTRRKIGEIKILQISAFNVGLYKLPRLHARPLLCFISFFVCFESNMGQIRSASTDIKNLNVFR